MIIIQNGFECDYEMRIFANLYFTENDDVFIFSNFKYKNKVINVYTEIIYRGKTYFDDYFYSFDDEEKEKSLIKKIFTASCTKSFCHSAQKIKKVNLPWGVMCGIRPAKNVRTLFEKGYSDGEVSKILKDVYEVSDEKIKLAKTVAGNEAEIIRNIDKNSVSIYIGIPFCPTRCLYCSFVSTDIRVSGKYMDGFVEKLLLEIDKTAQIMEKIGVYAENIYIGGGTPTTIEPRHLEKIFKRLRERFDFSLVKEFTLEAGRPDTINEEKLYASLNGGVSRISINPQTMNDETLKKVGRRHTSEMVRDRFYLARKAGFKNINMDLIAGLPDEDSDMFRYSVDEIIKLDPENITVHSMAVKRAASFRLTGGELTHSDAMNEMLSYAQRRMFETERFPYYMYRQKNISGNLENVGYSKKGFMNAYNVNIMEEKQTIIALGGGGSTKLVMGDRIERIFNFKDPAEYIKRFDEILKKKDEIPVIVNKNMGG